MEDFRTETFGNRSMFNAIFKSLWRISFCTKDPNLKMLSGKARSNLVWLPYLSQYNCYQTACAACTLFSCSVCQIVANSILVCSWANLMDRLHLQKYVWKSSKWLVFTNHRKELHCHGALLILRCRASREWQDKQFNGRIDPYLSLKNRCHSLLLGDIAFCNRLL